MTRAQTLATLRIAGYHDDSQTWTRTYLEGRVSRAAADAAWREGQHAKAAGRPCTCTACRPPRRAED
jgi:hypothetical protein